MYSSYKLIFKGNLKEWLVVSNIYGDGSFCRLSKVPKSVSFLFSCSVQSCGPANCHGSTRNAIPRPTPYWSRPSSLQPQRAGIFLLPTHNTHPATTILHNTHHTNIPGTQWINYFFISYI